MKELGLCTLHFTRLGGAFHWLQPKAPPSQEFNLYDFFFTCLRMWDVTCGFVWFQVLIGQNLLVEAWQSRWRAHVVDASEHEPPKLPANEEPCTSCADESKEAKIVHPAGKALSVSTGHDVAGTHSTWQKLKKQVESDHRFFWSETSSDGVAVFGLAGALGFAFVEVSARSELNRELIERYDSFPDMCLPCCCVL